MKIHNYFILLLLITLSGYSSNSDESIIRDEFNIPDSAELIYFKVYPGEAGWFGRER